MAHTDSVKLVIKSNLMVVQDIIVYGVLALLFLLTIILLGIDIGNTDQYSQFIPQSTTRLHIAALVFLLICFSSCYC